LDIFRDRDFGLCNVGVAVVSFAATALMVPLPFYAQAVCGLSPIRSALLIAPMAVANAVFAPFVGRIVDRYHPRPVVGFGFSVLAIGLTWLAFEMAPGTPIWRLVLPFFAVGVGMAFVWSPLTATATRNLPPHLAGAGSAVFNSIRQLGAVLGSAAMAAFMTSRIGAEMPRQLPSAAAGEGDVTLQLPEFLRAPFSAAMSQSVLLPAFIALFGIAAALFLVGFPSAIGRKGEGRNSFTPDDGDLVDDGYDDDDYVELILLREPDAGPPPRPEPRRAPTDDWHSEPVDSWDSLLGFAHNGSHVEDGKRFRPIASPSADDPTGYGRHSSG
jgi:MFS family permease